MERVFVRLYQKQPFLRFVRPVCGFYFSAAVIVAVRIILQCVEIRGGADRAYGGRLAEQACRGAQARRAGNHKKFCQCKRSGN